MRIDPTNPPAPDVRRSWVAPSYAKVKAGDAEGPGPNPDTVDGPFTHS